MAAPATSNADEAYSEDAVKAAYLYRIAGYIEWPAAALARPQFTLAVLNDEGIANELTRLLQRHSIKMLPARVNKISNLHELGDAQLLYIGPASSFDLQSLTDGLATRPVLVVTDQAGALERGGAINFVQIDHRVRFEVSVSAAERAGLKIGSELLAVAVRVQGNHPRGGSSCYPDSSTAQGGAGCTDKVVAP